MPQELLITAAGKNVAPVPIEDTIKSELPALISNCVVVGDRRKFLAALFTFKVGHGASGQRNFANVRITYSVFRGPSLCTGCLEPGIVKAAS